MDDAEEPRVDAAPAETTDPLEAAEATKLARREQQAALRAARSMISPNADVRDLDYWGFAQAVSSLTQSVFKDRPFYITVHTPNLHAGQAKAGMSSLRVWREAPKASQSHPQWDNNRALVETWQRDASRLLQYLQQQCIEVQGTEEVSVNPDAYCKGYTLYSLASKPLPVNDRPLSQFDQDLAHYGLAEANRRKAARETQE